MQKGKKTVPKHVKTYVSLSWCWINSFLFLHVKQKPINKKKTDFHPPTTSTLSKNAVFFFFEDDLLPWIWSKRDWFLHSPTKLQENLTTYLQCTVMGFGVEGNRVLCVLWRWPPPPPPPPSLPLPTHPLPPSPSSPPLLLSLLPGLS